MQAQARDFNNGDSGVPISQHSHSSAKDKNTLDRNDRASSEDYDPDHEHKRSVKEKPLTARAGSQQHQWDRYPEGSSSDKKTDSGEEFTQAVESQDITSKFYSFIVSATSPPTNKDQEIRHWKKEYKKAARAHQETQHHLNKKTKEAQHFHDQGYKFYMEVGALQKKVEMMDQERRALAAELGHTKQRLSDAISLSEVRGKELKGAQVFLTKADKLSVGDVVQKVSALNEEIFQASAFLAETLVYQAVDADKAEHANRRQAVIANTREAVGKYLGSRLADLLCIESMKPQEGPVNQLLVQIALTIALTRWCSSICGGWYPEDDYTSKVFEDLYDDIRRVADQAVAGRWRSLTRASLGIAADGWTKDVMHIITCIMDLAAWETQMQDDLTQFEKWLPSIFDALRDVRKATGEDVTSADLEVFAIKCGDEFEPSLMEESYEGYRVGTSAHGAEKERVAGPSGLGLKKVMVVSTRNGYEKRVEVLSLPKVVLDKTVKEAIESPPSPKSRKKENRWSSSTHPVSLIQFDHQCDCSE